MRNPSALSTFGTSVCTTQVDRKLAAVTPRNFRRKLQNKGSLKNRKRLCVCARARLQYGALCSQMYCLYLSSILKQIRKSVHESCSVEFLQIRVWLKQECVSCTVWLLICNILTDRDEYEAAQAVVKVLFCDMCYCVILPELTLKTVSEVQQGNG